MGGESKGFQIGYAAGEELDAGWSLGAAAPRRVSMPLKVTSLLSSDVSAIPFRQVPSNVPKPLRTPILNPLSADEVEAFALAEFALGTEVGRSVSEEHWFQELQCLVPRSRVRASSPPPSSKQACGTPASLDPSIERQRLSEQLSTEHVPSPQKKPGWWNRLRSSLRP